MTDLQALTRAVQGVLAVLNIHPDSLEFDAGVVRRMRQHPPWIRSLRGVRQMLVYAGTVPAAGPQEPAALAATRALGALTDAVRAECENLLVVWDEPGHGLRAAAWAVTRRHELGALLATSWSDPASWAEPMIDASRPVAEVLTDALARLREVADARLAGDALTRAFKLVDLALKSAGGEGQDTSGAPGAGAPAAEWSRWFARYESSVLDEWHRVRGRLASERLRAARPTAAGPLSGRRVFLSYARPDATSLARPVTEALRAQGADVWFDQEEPLDEDLLDRGLAEVIAGCDAYVLCASDEFFERAGYATQEVAWAVRASGGDSPLRSLVVVARPDTVLPTLARQWPVIELPAGGVPDLGPELAAGLAASGPVPVLDVGLSVGAPVGRSPGLPVEADVATLSARIRHRQRLFDTSPEGVSRIAGAGQQDARDAQLAAALRRIGAGLDWDGSLTGHADWPADPLIRGYRWMLGTHRAIAGVRWPLSGSLDDLDDIAGDVELLATRPVPALDRADDLCWGAEERRLLVRFQLGELRMLEKLLARGLWAGLIEVPESTLDQWGAQLPARRRDCIDALIAMRLSGGLSWRSSTPTWEQLYGHWHDALVHRSAVHESLPAEVRFVLTGQVEMLSAVAAQVAWQALRTGEPAVQQFTGRTPLPVTWRTRVTPGGAGTTGLPATGRAVELELCPADPAGPWVVRTSWHGFADPDGSVTSAAPEGLGQAMNLSSA